MASKYKQYFCLVLLLTIIMTAYHITHTYGVAETTSISTWTKRETKHRPLTSSTPETAEAEITKRIKKLMPNPLGAIAKGAGEIYMSGENLSTNKMGAFHHDTEFRGLLYQGGKFFNPFNHFGGISLPSTGFPDQNNVSDEYIIGPWRSPAIQQAICNTVNDVKFDLSNPPTAVRIGVYSPFLPCDTLFRYDAYWAILFYKLNICSTLRGFIIQRLLWETGNIVGYFPSNNPVQFDSHTHGCVRTQGLIKLLLEWRCDEDNAIFLCITKLSKELETQKYLTKDDLISIETWLLEIKSVGYIEPNRVNNTQLKHGATAVIEPKVPGQSDTTSPFVKTLFQPHTTNNNSQLLKNLDPVSIEIVNQACKHVSMNASKLLNNIKIKRYDNIVLIIVFNYPHYDNVPYLDLMYRPYFKHIVYCGNNRTSYVKNGYIKHATFIEANVHRGWFGYRCMVQVMRMNYDVEGYLHLGDDVLLNVWNLHRFPMDMLWIHGISSLNSTRPNPGYYWSEREEVGRGRYNVALKAASTLNQTIWGGFLEQLKENTGSSEKMYQGVSDIMYVPKRFEVDVLYFLEHFSKFKLFHEITFPTVFSGLDKLRRIFRLPGKYIWDWHRSFYENFFDVEMLFLHPFKIVKELKRKKGKKFFCENFLSALFNRTRR